MTEQSKSVQWSKEDHANCTYGLGRALLAIWDDMPPEIQAQLLEKAAEKSRSLIGNPDIVQYLKLYVHQNKQT